MDTAGKSKFEQAVVNLVKAKRTSDKLSHEDLARFLEVSRGSMGQVESPNERTITTSTKSTASPKNSAAPPAN
jgi:DNA-binding XRE family transcriptional regulator